MRLNTFESLKPYTPGQNGFRGGNITFYDLMTGVEGSPNNYGLQLVQVPDLYTTPRHRHNFEQLRVMLDGSFGFGPDQVQQAGTVGYFCEGTYYTQHGEGASTTLLLQIGGPSGAGFMSRAQVRAAIAALSAKGSFANGIYTWFDDQGVKHNQDSYEAAWEHTFGRPISYPRPRFHAPVLLTTERFAWRPLAGSSAVQVRELGRFNEYGLGMSQWKLPAGTVWRCTAGQAMLVFCELGEGSVDGLDFARWSTLGLDDEETVSLSARTDCLFSVFLLPDFLHVALREPLGLRAA
jgi:hypothetical protein